MSLDVLTEDAAPTKAPSRVRWLVVAVAGLASVVLTGIGLWTLVQNASSSAERANHDALLESVDLMPPMWEQLQLPVDQRSQAVIESGARIGRTGSAIEVTPQLRVNEPNRIGVATTVRSDGITTVLVTIVRNDLSGNSDALGSGCEIGTTVDGLTCQDWVNKQFTTWTAPGG